MVRRCPAPVPLTVSKSPIAIHDRRQQKKLISIEILRPPPPDAGHTMRLLTSVRTQLPAPSSARAPGRPPSSPASAQSRLRPGAPRRAHLLASPAPPRQHPSHHRPRQKVAQIRTRVAHIAQKGILRARAARAWLVHLSVRAGGPTVGTPSIMNPRTARAAHQRTHARASRQKRWAMAHGKRCHLRLPD